MPNKRVILTVGLTLIIALTALCVFGAFIGAERTHKAFNSIPFAAFWFFFVFLLAIGIFSFRNLFRKPALFAMHLGFILLILGSMTGTEIYNNQFASAGLTKIYRGKMLIFEGGSQNKVLAEPGTMAVLPFAIKLDDFRIEYYPDDSNAVKDYFSDIEIIKDSNTVKTATIEVNKPLHFGGYHIYQHGYDEQHGRFTILEVVSDTGLSIIYAGFIFVCIGVAWHFWYERLIKKRYL
ncbi:MAG: cytochrome c biogenesis protein ResB [Phycisphaerae bacterium]|nr:cytochrome c biogenesis protein ResB [Phycisphaerae bacterium]